MSRTLADSLHSDDPRRTAGPFVSAHDVDTTGQLCLDVTHRDAVRRSEFDARIRSIVDRAPIGRIDCGLDGAVTSVNSRMAEMLGYAPNEMAGRPVHSFLSATTSDDVRARAAALADEPENITCTVRRFLHRDGSEFLASVTSAMMYDSTGIADGWVSLVVDLTEDKREPVAATSAHAFARAVERRLGLQHAVAVASNEAGSLDDVAPTVLRIVCEHFGWKAGALLAVPGGREGSTGSPRIEFGFGDCSRLERHALRHPGSSDVIVEARPDGSTTVLVPLVAVSSPDVRALVFDASSAVPGPEHLETLRMVGLQTTQVIERQATAQKLREGEQRFRSVFDSSPLPMAITLGQSGTFGVVNAAFCELLGRPAEDLLGRPATAVLHPDDLHIADPAGAAAAASPDRRNSTLMRFLHSSGQVIYCNTTLSWIDGSDGESNLLAQFEDITARRAAELAVDWQAKHDVLTGLLNRAGLTNDLRVMGGENALAAVLFIDIDSFKLINDTRGHDAGDQVLFGVAARLRGLGRSTDLVARFGGDEFVMVCPLAGCDPIEMAVGIADRIDAALAEPFDTAAGPVVVTASVGVAQGVVNALEPQRLIQQADAAMNRAKDLGKARRIFYDQELNQRAVDRVRTEAALRTALDDGRFVLHLQPIVRLDDSTVVGFEALVRLIDENGALVPPGDFISVAEQTGLIVPMGTWVIRQSCQILARLRASTGRPLTISVNVAARQAARPDLGGIVIDALRAAGLPDDALTLELTESALLEANEETLSQLRMLRGRGIGIALDDFGTGYSSLTYLRRLPVSCLKIDRSFVQDMMATSSDRAIVRAVANLASDLGLTWVAEGVESIEQRRALREFGPGLEQGYLFSRPLPVAQLIALLEAQG